VRKKEEKNEKSAFVRLFVSCDEKPYYYFFLFHKEEKEREKETETEVIFFDAH